MKRRKFLSSCITSSLIMTPFNDIIGTKFNNPKLIFDSHSDPATIAHINRDKFTYIPDKTVGQSDVIITCNKYGKPSDVFFKKRIKNKEQQIKISIPETRERFSYTIYSDLEDGLNYIGESLPMIKQSNSIDTDLDSLESPESSLNYRRSVKRGYYNMEFNINDRSYSFPISQQYYTMNKRIVQYGRSQSRIRDSEFLEKIGKKILKQLNVDKKYQKFHILAEFAQNVNWVRDLESKNKFEYIRDPRRTVTNYIGDCKDSTILLNGLIENVLDIHTVMFFAPTHIYSGIKYDSLPTEIKENIDEKRESYNINGKKYIPLESTGEFKIGREPVSSPMYMYYDRSYNIRNLSGLKKHIKKLPQHISKKL